MSELIEIYSSSEDDKENEKEGKRRYDFVLYLSY